MKKKTLVLLALAVIPTLALANTFTFKVGFYIPKGGAQSDDNLWKTEFDQMSFTKSGFNNTIFGVAYEYFLNRYMSIQVGFDTYSKSKSGYYRDYVRSGDFAFPNDYMGQSIVHTFHVSSTPMQLSFKITPTGRRARLIPYLGGGVGVYLWNVRLYGEMVDFSDDSYYYPDPIYGDVQVWPIKLVDAREDNKLSVGYHAFGGIMIPVGTRMTMEIEFKYNSAQGDLNEAFEGFEPFDLSAYQLSIGLNYWF